MGAKCRSQCKRGYGAVQQVRTAASPAEITAAKIQAITDAVQTAKTQIQTAQKTAEERRRNIGSLRATLLYNNVCQPAKFYKLRPNAAPEFVAERKGGVTFAVDKDGTWLLSEAGNILTDRFGLLLAGSGTITPSLNGRKPIKLGNNLFY